MNIFIAVIAAVVLGLGGFFWFSAQTPEDSVPPPVTEPSPVPAPAPAPATPPAGANNQPSAINANVNVTVETKTVGITSYQYSPKVLTVKVGTKVTWTNNDTVAHTVTATGSSGGPDSTLFGQNESYSFTFDKVGTYEYYCKPHPYMKGTVVVTN